MTDLRTVELLKQSLSPSLPSTAQTKATFETKTSAINVVPSARGRYDIKQIQEDSLWLSAAAKIDEVSALRIVILEWQTRPAAQLQSSLVTDAPPPGRSFNGSISQSAFSASRTLLRSRTLPTESTTPDYSQSVDARRDRLLDIYLAECRYRLEVCRFLVFTALCATGDGKTVSSHQNATIPEWVESVGHDIFTAWDIHGVARVTGKNIFLSAIDELRSRIKDLEDGCDWFRDRDQQEPVQAVWCEGQVLEILAVMETMLIMFGALTSLSRSDVIKSWFKLMSDYSFFEIFEPVSLLFLNLVRRLTTSSPFRNCMTPTSGNFSRLHHSSPLRS